MLLLRMGYHAGERWGPQSRVIVWGSLQICIVLPFQKPHAVLWTQDHSIPIDTVVGGVGMHSYSTLLVAVTCLCLDAFIFRVLLVSPMFTLL